MHMGSLIIMYMGFYLFYLYYDSLRLTRHRSTCPVFGQFKEEFDLEILKSHTDRRNFSLSLSHCTVKDWRVS